MSEWIEILWGFAISWKYFEKQKSFISWRFAVPISGKDLIYKLLRNSSHLTLQNSPKWLTFETLHSSVIRPTFPTSIEKSSINCLLVLLFWTHFQNCFELVQIVFDRSKISFLFGPGPKTFFRTAFCYFNHFQIEMICSRVGSLLCLTNRIRICIEMVFCYQNCSDLLWEKIVLVIEKNFWNSRLKAVKGQNNFW